MKYWAYVNNEILGPFEKEKLLELPPFSPSLLVCPQTPVGEKTEEWKEASTYPEISALIGQGAQALAAAPPKTLAPAPPVQETPVPAAEPLQQPLIETTSLSFKPLTASQAVEPVPLAEPAPAPQPQQTSSSFDPISLSRIERRSGTLSGQNISGPAQPQQAPSTAAAEGIALEPQRTFSQPAGLGGAERHNPEKTGETAQINEQKPPPLPPGAAPAVADVAGLENLIQRLDALSKAAATRQDINSAVDPIRLKLDQMGEVISSIKNSQFQREVMDKLIYLENAAGDLKGAFRTAQQAPAPAKIQKLEIEKNPDTVYGVQPVKPAAEPKAAPVETVKPVEITDQGSKPSKIGPALKKAFRLLLTLVLLAAVLLGTVIGLKTFGVFDATKFIPFQLPFMGAHPVQPQQPGAAEEQAPGAVQEQVPPARLPEQPQASQEQAPEKAMQPDLAPEIIYIARTFKLKPAGQSLENKIYEHAGKAGGNYNRTAWKVKPAAEGMFEVTAVIPSKAGDLTYTYLVDRAKKTVQPSDEAGKAAFNALAKAAAQKPSARKTAKQKAAVKPAAGPQPKKASPEKPAQPDEEYEYVEDDGTEQ